MYLALRFTEGYPALNSLSQPSYNVADKLIENAVLYVTTLYETEIQYRIEGDVKKFFKGILFNSAPFIKNINIYKTKKKVSKFKKIYSHLIKAHFIKFLNNCKSIFRSNNITF